MGFYIILGGHITQMIPINITTTWTKGKGLNPTQRTAAD